MRRISTVLAGLSLALGTLVLPSYGDDVKVKDKVKDTGNGGYKEEAKVTGDGENVKAKTKTKVHHDKVESKTKVKDHGKTVYKEKEKEK